MALLFSFPSGGEIRKLGLAGSYLARYERVSSSLESFFFFGPTAHLWFFPSLICAILGLYFLSLLPYSRIWSWAFALGFYGAGVLGGSYSGTPWSVDLFCNHRHFLFFSLLPVWLGFELGRKPFRKNHWHWFWLCLFLFAALLGSHIETQYLFQVFQKSRNAHDYLFSTVWLGMACFCLALSLPTQLIPKWIGALGSISGGIYLTHIFVLQKLPYLEPYCPLWFWTWLSPILAYLLSAGLVLAIRSLKWGRLVLP